MTYIIKIYTCKHYTNLIKWLFKKKKKRQKRNHLFTSFHMDVKSHRTRLQADLSESGVQKEIMGLRHRDDFRISFISDSWKNILRTAHKRRRYFSTFIWHVALSWHSRNTRYSPSVHVKPKSKLTRQQYQCDDHRNRRMFTATSRIIGTLHLN